MTISGILAMVLIANTLVASLKFPVMPAWALLFAACALLYALDLSRFAFLPYATKAVIVGGLTSLPMLFSGIIFIRSFATTPSKEIALGANLIGSLLGGLLQAVTFLTGIRALLILVAAFYFLAFLMRPRAATATASPSAVHVP